MEKGASRSGLLPDLCPWERQQGLAYEGTFIDDREDSFVYECANACSLNPMCVAFSKTRVAGKHVQYAYQKRAGC